MNKNDNNSRLPFINTGVNKYDKIYRVLPTYDEGKVRDIFNFIDKLDTNRILNYSVENNIPLSICENADGDNLIHAVLNLKMLELSEHIKLNFIKFLVQKDVNPDKPNKYNQTPLILACKYQLNSIISYLLSLGVNINYQDNMGYTPLHYLVIGNIREIEENKQVLTFIPYNKSKKERDYLDILNTIKKEIYNYLTTTGQPSELTNKYVLTGGNTNNPNDIEIKLELDVLLKNIKGTVKHIYDYNKKNTSDLEEAMNKNIVINKTLENMHKLFGINKNRYIENIQVHTNESDKKSSWRPSDITGDTYLFKNYKIKSVVRQNVKSKLDEFKKLVDNYNVTEEIDNTYEIKSFFKTLINNKLFNKISKIKFVYDTIEEDKNSRYRNFYNTNNNGDIMDFENYQFFGGNNTIEIENDIDNNNNNGYEFNLDAIINTYFDNSEEEKGTNLLNFLITTLIYDGIFSNNNVINITDVNKLIAFNIYYSKYNNIEATMAEVENNNEYKKIYGNINKPYYVDYADTKSVEENINLWINYLLDHISKDEYHKKEKDMNNDIFIDFFENIEEPNFIDNVCLKIIDEFENLPYKPHLSVLLDTLFILNYYDNKKEEIKNKNTEVLENIKLLLELLNPFNITQIITNLDYKILIKDTLSMHTNYARFIFYINSNNVDVNINTNKFILSKCLGLNYNGILDSSEFKNISKNHTMNGFYPGTKLLDIQDNRSINKFLLRLPLDMEPFIFPSSGDLKTDIIIPSHHSYVYTIINIINKYEDGMKNAIRNVYNELENLLKEGIQTNIFNEIYTKYYPAILNISNIIYFYSDMLHNYLYKLNGLNKDDKLFVNNIILKYINLNKMITDELKKITDTVADLLNEINSYYFLYAYIYFEGKVNGFSYYKLPTSKNPSSFIYYYDANNQQINDTFKYEPQSGGASIKYSRSDIYDKYGVFGYSKFGNYKEILENYKKNLHEIIIKKENTEFNVKDKNILPQSIYDKLGLFYKYSIMSVLTKIVDKNLLDKLNNTDIKKILKLNSDDENINKLHIYEYGCKIIQDIIYDYLVFYVKNKLDTSNNPTNPTFKVDNNLVVYKLNDEILEGLDTNNKLIIYNILKEIKTLSTSDSPNSFILYPNDFSNTERTRTFYSININKDNIDLLLRMGANPYLLNIENKTCIYNIINNYNYNLLNHLKERGIDYRTFDNDKPINYIISDMKTNLQKVLGNNFDIIAKNIPTKNILNNITQLMYNRVVNSILSNNNFKNNVLILIEESFYMSSYLFINYLSKKLVYINDDFDIYDLNSICDLLDISENDINKDMINNININDDESIYNKMINEKIEKNLKILDIKNVERTKIMSSYDEINNDNIKQLLDDKLIEIDTEIDALEYENKKLEDIINNNNNNISDTDKYIKLFDSNINTNTDLIPLLMLIKQNILLRTNVTAHTLNQLNILKKGFAIFSNISEYYFNTPKFTDNNYILSDINNILKQTFELTIGYSAQLLIKKILLEYFLTQSSDKPEIISNKIDLIINTEIIDMLNNELFEELVKINAGIFENNDEKITYILKSTDRILISLFDKILENDILQDTDGSLKLVFLNSVTPYLNTIISNCIKYWYVNIENIMKYFINNHRCLETLSSL